MQVDLRDAGSTPGSGRFHGGGHSNALQYSCLENPMTEEPGGLQSIGLQRVRHEGSDLARIYVPHRLILHLLMDTYFAFIFWQL